MKTLLLTFIITAFGSFFFVNKSNKSKFKNMANKSFYDISIKGLDGGELDLNSFKGKKIMVVNVASECGFTPHINSLKSCIKHILSSWS